MSENTMTYNGYAAKIYYSDEDGLFVGRLAGIRHIVDFHGASVKELKKAFHHAVDDYLAGCQRAGITPQRPYSGKFMVRIDPKLHAKLAQHAETTSTPLNTIVNNAIENEVQKWVSK